LNNIILQSAAVDKVGERFADKKSKYINKNTWRSLKAVPDVSWHRQNGSQQDPYQQCHCQRTEKELTVNWSQVM